MSAALLIDILLWGSVFGRKDSALYVYPQADHGFNCGDRASYNARASALAHGRTLTFLGEHL